jgi:sec-independent protein translocase protein TatB
MFEVGFSEMLMIAFVALVVLGPEKLPKAARFAGLWIRRARAQWYSVKAELEREIAAEQLRTQVRDGLAEVTQEMQALQQPMPANPGNGPDPHDASPAKTPSAIAARDDHFAP